MSTKAEDAAQLAALQAAEARRDARYQAPRREGSVLKPPPPPTRADVLSRLKSIERELDLLQQEHAALTIELQEYEAAAHLAL